MHLIMIAKSPELCQVLFAQARAGCTESLGKLLNTFRPYLLAMANSELTSELQSKGGGSDLVQDTFISAQQNFENFRGNSIDELLNWLRQILKNNATNFQRHYLHTEKRAVSREIQLDVAIKSDNRRQLHSNELSPDDQLALSERFQLLELCLQQLPPKLREIVVMRSLECHSFKDIATRLQITESAAQKAWARAIVVLSRKLSANPKDLE